MAWIRPIQGFGGSVGPVTSAYPLLIAVPFTFATASPLAVVSLAAGEYIARADVQITTAFDNAGALLTLGDSGDPDSILTSAEIDATLVGSYRTFDYFEGAASIELAITPAGSTAGAGVVYLQIWAT